MTQIDEAKKIVAAIQAALKDIPREAFSDLLDANAKQATRPDNSIDRRAHACLDNIAVHLRDLDAECKKFVASHS